MSANDNAVNKGHSTPDDRSCRIPGLTRGNLTRALTNVVITSEYHRRARHYNWIMDAIISQVYVTVI